jgi:hypothetical protein
MATLMGCVNSTQQNVQIDSSIAKTITTSQTTPSITIPLTSPIQSSITTSNAPEFTANIVTINDPYYSNGIIFYNSTSAFLSFSCTVRQHDTDGSFLSDENVQSNFVPPHSHLVTVLSDLVLHSPTIVNLQPIDPPNGWQIFSMSVKDIQTESITLSNSNTPTLFLEGTLFNNSSVTPNIRMQILSNTSSGNLTIVGFGDVIYSNPLTGTQVPVPPPGESVKFYTPLIQPIHIEDSTNAIIDGEINVYGYYH